VLKALTELGYTYDFYNAPNFPPVYSAYDVIIQGMDGGTVTQIPQLASYIIAGGYAILLGGSSLQPFVLDVSANLMNVNQTYYAWARVAGSPDITTIPHPLTSGLPATYDFVNNDATAYMLRIVESVPTVAATNGDGYKAIVAKQLGSGKFTWFINSPYDGYYANAGDYNYLKIYLRNALVWGTMKYQYHFRLSPYINVINVNVSAAGWIYGYQTGGPTGWNPVLGKYYGNRFYMAIDVYPDQLPGYFELLFLVGTISSKTGKLIQTYNGKTYFGPWAVTLVPVAAETEKQDDANAGDISSQANAQAWYSFKINPYIDVWNITTNPGGWLNGYRTNPADNFPILGFTEGDKFYLALDGLGTGYTLIFVAGTISSKTGQMVRTSDGRDLVGPENVWLT
jgi:hypothetical protein